MILQLIFKFKTHLLAHSFPPEDFLTRCNGIAYNRFVSAFLLFLFLLLHQSLLTETFLGFTLLVLLIFCHVFYRGTL